MREFNLANAIVAFSTYSGTLSTLWGLYIAATFAAAGFGASMKEQFTTQTALLMTAAFLAFTGARLRAVMANLKVLRSIRSEVLNRLEAGPAEITDYPATVTAALSIALSPAASVAVHVVIDLCVVAVIWASVS
jgi:hypothetical protein